MDHNPSDKFLNRELSWLDFNARVLAMAQDPKRPLMERVKFLSIFAENLDEFYEVRISALEEQIVAGITTLSHDGLTPAEQMSAIRTHVNQLVDRQSATFRLDVVPALEKVGIHFVQWADLNQQDRDELTARFTSDVFPVLTPLAVDPAHPFPYISNLSLNLAVVVCEPGSKHRRFARVKVPPILPRFLPLKDQERFIPLESLIAAHLSFLFPGLEIIEEHPFRVTRNADFELADEAEDLMAAVEVVVRQRTKFGRAVRLEVTPDMPESVLNLLSRELDLNPDHANVMEGPLDLSGLSALYQLPRPELKDPVWTPQTQPELADTDVPADFFAVLNRHDVMVQYPYDSFATSVEAFLMQAAQDPKVLAIKQTLYRTAGPDESIVRSLITAAEAGKQVVALVELKARFDEQANIQRARTLEEAGVHVVYGLVGLKTHAKTLLIVRKDDDSIRRYCHLATGNYNPLTATVYEDIGLFTADRELGEDISELFNWLTGYSYQEKYRKLLVAPRSLRHELHHLIKQEAKKGADGFISLKLNALADSKTIDELYMASQKGTRVDLLIRGICCLKPGVPELSENVRVRSLLGRFLEHSRIFRFGKNGESKYFIGSPDVMPRNLDSRVEVIAPIEDPALQRRLQEILDMEWSDDVLAWELDGGGSWHKVSEVIGFNAHQRLQDLAVERAHKPTYAFVEDQENMEDIEVHAAGGVVYEHHDDETHVLLIHRPKYADWSFPKGKLEKGETYEDGAIREVFEETGYQCELEDELPSVRYRDTKDRSKLVCYWLMRAEDPLKDFTPNAEVDKILWCTVEKALDMLTHERDRELLQHAQLTWTK